MKQTFNIQTWAQSKLFLFTTLQNVVIVSFMNHSHTFAKCGVAIHLMSQKLDCGQTVNKYDCLFLSFSIYLQNVEPILMDFIFRVILRRTMIQRQKTPIQNNVSQMKKLRNQIVSGNASLFFCFTFICEMPLYLPLPPTHMYVFILQFMVYQFSI